MVRRNSRRVYERESRGRRLLEGCKVSTCPLKGSVEVKMLDWLEARGLRQGPRDFDFVNY